MKLLKTFPFAIVSKTNAVYNKAFHAKIFTLFASSESELYGFALKSQIHYRYCFAFMKSDEGQWFLENAGIERVRQWVAAKAKTGTSHVIKLYRPWQKEWKKYLNLSKKLLDTDLQKLTDPEVLKVFENFYLQYLRVGGVAYMADCFMSTGEQDWLEETLKKELGRNSETKNFGGAIKTLVLPKDLSFTAAEDLELLSLAQSFHKRFRDKLPGIPEL